jgi:hypothetical protein
VKRDVQEPSVSSFLLSGEAYHSSNAFASYTWDATLDEEAQLIGEAEDEQADLALEQELAQVGEEAEDDESDADEGDVDEELDVE